MQYFLENQFTFWLYSLISLFQHSEEEQTFLRHLWSCKAKFAKIFAHLIDNVHLLQILQLHNLWAKSQHLFV